MTSDQFGELGPEDAGTVQYHDSREQDDEPAQAQTLADEVRHQRATGPSPTQSARVNGPLHEASEQDVVDHMRDMESSGRIDMAAFRGEPNHDDNAGKYGRGHDADGFEVDDS